MVRLFLRVQKTEEYLGHLITCSLCKCPMSVYVNKHTSRTSGFFYSRSLLSFPSSRRTLLRSTLSLRPYSSINPSSSFSFFPSVTLVTCVVTIFPSPSPELQSLTSPFFHDLRPRLPPSFSLHYFRLVVSTTSRQTSPVTYPVTPSTVLHNRSGILGP